MAKRNREPAQLEWLALKTPDDVSLKRIDKFLKGLARFAKKYVHHADDQKTIRYLVDDLRDAARLGDIWQTVQYSYDLGRELADAVRDVWSGHSGLPKLKAMRESLSHGARTTATAKRCRAEQYAERVFQHAYP